MAKTNEVTQLLQVSSCLDGVYSVHEEGQRPVEGTAVYQYSKSWSCEEHAPVSDCGHINLVKEHLRLANLVSTLDSETGQLSCIHCGTTVDKDHQSEMIQHVWDHRETVKGEKLNE